MTQTYTIHSLVELERLATKLSPLLKMGTVIALQGELGAGKTTFTQLLAKNLNITTPVVSPTFTILKTYPLANERYLHHFDLYRLRSTAEVEALGIDEYLPDPAGITVIEWPEIIKELLPAEKTLWIAFKIINENERELIISNL